MERTHRAKRLLGLDAGGPVGVRSDREHEAHDCTVCDTRFDADETTCPSCGSRLFRTKTVVPNAALNLLLTLVLSGLGVVYNLLTGEVPKE
jgi:uncharacterized paraquat-inducible protein A